jgi:hypothetical protein
LVSQIESIFGRNMVRVFALKVPDNTDWVNPGSAEAKQAALQLQSSSESIAAGWRSPAYVYATRRKGEPVDIPWDGYGNLCLRESARQQLEPLVAPYGEFLPVLLDDTERVWLFHLIGSVPAMDLDRSAFETLPSGSTGKVEVYWFDTGIVGGRPIFRIPQKGRPFVTDQFVAAVKAAGLTGLDFKLLWDSEWTVPPVPLLIVSGYWPPLAWDEAESARRTSTFLTELGTLDPALQAWRRRGRGPLPEQAMAMPLTDAAVAKALARIKERGRNADAIYHDGGIWNAPPNELIHVEFQQATGTGERFVNSFWGGVAHLRMFDLREEHTKHATPEGVLALFEAMRAAWPVKHLVARTTIFQDHTELKSYPLLGWITWLTAQGRVADRDPDLPAGVRILDRTSDTLTLQLGPWLQNTGLDTYEAVRPIVQATIQALEVHGWLVQQDPPTPSRKS